MDFPVYARGITPNGPYKNGPGEINVPVVIGGKVVFPGDIVVGDGDGTVDGMTNGVDAIKGEFSENGVKNNIKHLASCCRVNTS